MNNKNIFVSSHYATEISETPEHDEWNKFLSCIDEGYYEQTTCWSELERTKGCHSVRIIVRRDGKIAGGAQLSIQSKRLLGIIVYVRWGPCFMDDDPKVRQLWVDKLHAYAKKLPAAYVVVNSCCRRNDGLVSFLKSRGFRSKKEKLPPWNLTTATLIIDLTKSLDVLLYDMRQELRREIRIGTESGLKFRCGDEKDLSVFFGLMKRTAERRGQSPVPSNLLFLQQLWQAFHPFGWVRLFWVEKSDKVISAGLIFTFGLTVRFWKYGWLGEDTKMRPNQFLFWNLIKWSKENGFKYFDIVQVEPDIAECLKNKHPLTEQQKKNPLFGPTMFKLGFGGEVFHYPGAYYRFYNPLMGLLFEFMVCPLMKIQFIGRVIRSHT